MKLLTSLLLLVLLPLTANAQQFKSLFNGKDLAGWAGKNGFWTVKDGAIFGETTKEKPTKGNTFLVWQGGDVADFVFKAKVRFSGNNSGVQYRSELVGKPARRPAHPQTMHTVVQFVSREVSLDSVDLVTCR